MVYDWCICLTVYIHSTLCKFEEALFTIDSRTRDPNTSVVDVICGDVALDGDALEERDENRYTNGLIAVTEAEVSSLR